jgi:NitT/TauT family transport system permease protein
MVSRLPRTVGSAAAAGALFTLGIALGGLVLGGIGGVLLALLMQRFALAEKAVLPYVVASQTVPLIAIAPLVVGWGGKITIAGWEWQPWAGVIGCSWPSSPFVRRRGIRAVGAARGAGCGRR